MILLTPQVTYNLMEEMNIPITNSSESMIAFFQDSMIIGLESSMI